MMQPISLEEKIRRCIERNPTWDDKRISNSIGCRRPLIQAFREGKPLPMPMPTAPNPAPSSSGESGLISLDKVIQRYDVRAAIYRELAAIPKGKFILESDLCRLTAGTDKARFNKTREIYEVEFAPLRIKLKLKYDENEGKWYWADRETVAEAQRIRDL